MHANIKMNNHHILPVRFFVSIHFTNFTITCIDFYCCLTQSYKTHQPYLNINKLFGQYNRLFKIISRQRTQRVLRITFILPSDSFGPFQHRV